MEEGASSDEDDEQEELQYLRNVCSTSRKHSQSTPLTVPTVLLGKELLMEVDTGTSVSVMAEETYRSLWDAQSRPHLRETSINLQTYTNGRIDVRGEVEVTGTVQGQQVEGKLPLIVGARNGLTLLGHDWLERIRLEWARIKLLRTTPVEKLQDLLRHYEDVL